jgi:hypothetical protein
MKFGLRVMLTAAAMARTNTTDSREQGGNAYKENDTFHILSYFVISSEDFSRGVTYSP